MRTGLLAPALGITLCVALALVSVYGNNWPVVSGPGQDDNWTVIEYPEGQEVTVEFKSGASVPDARGTARVTRSGNETTISLDVSGVTGDESTHQVYVVDSLGNATELGTLTIADGSGNLNAKTALSKFMIVISPEAALTTILSDSKVLLRSTVPSGFSVVPKEQAAEEKSGEAESVEATVSDPQIEPAITEPQDYEVPLIGIGRLKRGANTTMKANASRGFEAARAHVVIRPVKNGPTQIKMRFSNLKEIPEGTQYLLWAVTPDHSYTLLGHLTQAGKKGESKIDAETSLPDFGLMITFENAEAITPAGSIVATIVK